MVGLTDFRGVNEPEADVLPGTPDGIYHFPGETGEISLLSLDEEYPVKVDGEQVGTIGPGTDTIHFPIPDTIGTHTVTVGPRTREWQVHPPGAEWTPDPDQGRPGYSTGDFTNVDNSEDTDLADQPGFVHSDDTAVGAEVAPGIKDSVDMSVDDLVGGSTSSTSSASTTTSSTSTSSTSTTLARLAPLALVALAGIGWWLL